MVDKEYFTSYEVILLEGLLRGEQKEGNLLLQLQLFLYFDIFNCKNNERHRNKQRMYPRMLVKILVLLTKKLGYS